MIYSGVFNFSLGIHTNSEDGMLLDPTVNTGHGRHDCRRTSQSQHVRQQPRAPAFVGYHTGMDWGIW